MCSLLYKISNWIFKLVYIIISSFTYENEFEITSTIFEYISKKRIFRNTKKNPFFLNI